MQQAELKVVGRTGGTKSETKSLRTQGLVPASIYGPKIVNQNCAFSEKEMRKVFSNDFGSNFILTLASDSKDLNGKRVVLKNVDRDPLTWALTHADFYEIAMDRPLTVSVPLRFNGNPEGVKTGGGILQVIRRSVRIKALPDAIPAAVDVDISGMQLNDSLHLADLKFSDKITVLDSTSFTVVSIVEAEKEEVKEVAVAAEGTATATATGTGAAAATATAAGADKAAAKK